MGKRADEGKKHRIEGIIKRFCASRQNSLGLETEEPAWGPPLIGYARGDDPEFVKLQKDIGPFYWTPLEAFTLAFPKASVTAANLSVVVFVLPQTESTRSDQRYETALPAERWARSRFYGEAFNCALRLHLADELTASGYPSVAPERLPEFGYRQSDRFGLASNWSERHTAWIAGIGTFGLSEGLITRLGKAVRFGSVVVQMDLEASPREYGNHQAWCLWYAQGKCGVCIQRCPVDAISPEGHDKLKCHGYIRDVTAPYVHEQYGLGATPCGLCQVKIPCEASRPL